MWSWALDHYPTETYPAFFKIFYGVNESGEEVVELAGSGTMAPASVPKSDLELMRAMRQKQDERRRAKQEVELLELDPGTDTPPDE